VTHESSEPSELGVPKLLDPQIAAALESFGLADMQLHAGSLEQFREVLATSAPYEPSGEVSISVIEVPGPVGSPPITLRIHRPASPEGLLPCLYFMHGGGMVMGVAARDDQRFDSWCRKLGVIAIAVEYRLAPETPFPGPLDDCYAGLVYAFEHAEELGIDRERIGVGGASAGAGLAAGLALMVRDRAEVQLRFQLLIYPMIDDRMITASSQWSDAPVWSPSSNRYGWSCYLGEQFGRSDVSEYAAPARAQNLAGLPSAFVMVGTLDGFLDEDIDYANRLMRAGVPTELHVYPGAVHGFDGLPGVDVSRRANKDMLHWLSLQVAT
jgi:acetyl esterase/lipase